MTHPLTPREKVVVKQACDHCQRMTTVDLTALASGSGDHAELIGVLRADRLPECSFDDGKTWELDGVGVAETFSRAADALEALLAENAALRVKVRTEIKLSVDNYVRATARATEAERKLAEARAVIERLASSEAFDMPRAIDGPLAAEVRARMDYARTFLSKEAERGCA